MISTCLSIAGFDGSGGAGIQADLKTFGAFGCYGMTVLTAMPIQNTQGVKKCYSIPLPVITEQLETLFEDIRPDSIKIGMLYSKEIIELIANFIATNAKNIPIVLDPVMIAKSGDLLLKTDAIHSLKETIIPLCTIITPNLPEAHALVGNDIESSFLAKQLLMLGSKAVLLKGGHSNTNRCDDLYLDHLGNEFLFKANRIASENTHGTGCTLSSAIAAMLALGYSLPEACKSAKTFLSNAIEKSKDNKIGKGNGPLHHFHYINFLSTPNLGQL